MNLLSERRSYLSTSSTHDHEFAQLILPLRGHLKIETNKYDLKLDQDHLFFLPSDCRHTFKSDVKNDFLVVDIPNKVSQSVVGFSIEEEQYRRLDDKWKAIRYLISEETKKMNTKGLRDLLTYALGHLHDEVLAPSIQFIHDHFNESIRTEELAFIEGYQVSAYIGWFFRQTGSTPNDYIQKLRVEYAKKLLKDTSHDLLMIAGLIGYEHQSSFTRVFKKHMLISPNQYRKQILDKKRRNMDKYNL